MRSIIWLIAAVLLTALTASAASPPPIQWERKFQSFDTGCAWIVQTNDGGFMAAGHLGVNPHQGDVDMYLLKMDSLGSTQWQRTYSTGTTHDYALSVQQTVDRGYVLAGMGGDSGKVIVLKTDSLGNPQWRFSRFGSATVYNVQQTADGGYITAGLWWKNDSLYLLKLNSSGNMVWRKSYDEFYRHWIDRIPVKQTSDGGYIIAAEVLLKTDSQGNQLWKRKYPDVLVMFSVQETQDGGFVAAGIARAPWPLGQIKPFNMVLLKTNSSGVLQWKRVFTDGNESDGRCVGLTGDGGFVVGGSVTIGHFDHAYIVRTNSQGNPLWTKTLEERTGAECIQQTSDGGYILCSGDRRIWKLAPEQ